MGCVYVATNKVNGKQYVGKTIKLMANRRYVHEYFAARDDLPVMIFHRALKKYGFDSFDWDIVFESDDNAMLLRVEIMTIGEFDSLQPKGYNIAKGGNGSGAVTDETRRKMSESGKKRKPIEGPRLVWRQRLSDAARNRKITPAILDGRVRAADKKRGRKAMPEAIERLRQSLISHYENREDRPGSKITADDVRDIRSLRERGLTLAVLARLFGTTQSHIWSVVHRRIWRSIH